MLSMVDQEVPPVFRPKIRILIFLLVVLAAVVVLPGCKGTVDVPDLTGLTATMACEKLEDLGFRACLECAHSEADEGCVLVVATHPPAGEKAERGSEISLEVEITLPSVSGWNESKAVSLIESLGLKAVVETAYSEDFGAGLVVGTAPEEGNTCAPGTEVHVTVSKGPLLVTCPECHGKGQVLRTVDCKRSANPFCREQIWVCCPECSGDGRVPRQ